MNKSRAPSEVFCVGLELEVRKFQAIDLSETIQFATKKISWKFMIILQDSEWENERWKKSK